MINIDPKPMKAVEGDGKIPCEKSKNTRTPAQPNHPSRPSQPMQQAPLTMPSGVALRS